VHLVQTKVDQSVEPRYRKDLPLIAVSSILDEYISKKSKSFALVHRISQRFHGDWLNFFIKQIKETLTHNFDNWTRAISAPYSDLPDGEHLQPFYLDSGGKVILPNVFSPFHLCYQSIRQGVVLMSLFAELIVRRDRSCRIGMPSPGGLEDRDQGVRLERYRK
jgi:hypothetical protein